MTEGAHWRHEEVLELLKVWGEETIFSETTYVGPQCKLNSVQLEYLIRARAKTRSVECDLDWLGFARVSPISGIFLRVCTGTKNLEMWIAIEIPLFHVCE